MDTITLKTERLLLRPFRETDLQELFECCQNPNLGNNAGWEPHKSIEDSKEILHTVFMGNEGVFAMILKENNSLVGSIGFIPDPNRVLAEGVPLGKRNSFGSNTCRIGLWI